jgi:1-acyl-sn-glycerol-3-phosphate acyltransferase
MLYTILKPVLWLLTRIICRYKVFGRENIPQDGPVLVVANHLIWYDPALIGVIFPRRLWFMAKIEIFRLPLIGLGCLLTGQIPVHRGESDRAALEQALDYLQQGRAVTIFPEGIVARHEGLMTAHAGAAMLALRSGVPILPVAHSGTQRIFVSRSTWLPRVVVRIGEPYVPQIPAGVSRKAALKMVTEDLMLRIARMLPPEDRGAYAMLTDGSEREPAHVLLQHEEAPKDV